MEMRTDGVIANPAIQDAKAAWMDKFTGAVLEKQVQFGSPVVQNLFKRTFYITARNCHFISVFGRVLLGEEQAKQAEDHLNERMQKSKDFLEAVIKAANLEIEDANLGNFYWKAPSEGGVKLTSRTSTRHLELLILADTYISKVHTLWIGDLMDDQTRARTEREVKKQMRAIASTARELFMGLRKRLNAKGQVPALVDSEDDQQHDDEAGGEAAGEAAGEYGAQPAGDLAVAAAKPRARKPAAPKEATVDEQTTGVVAETV
ncbi:AcaB family transcriptional regulator [Duganella vulcania]|uniref:DUF1845 domain-containing protein n=1 Tax=Duganella vulcania TaxID=2692166 RepID=A0A845GEL7_9BURK|nr:AcaB family transcriptional regulator [Duganella vulcania]MYM92744.1 DUF1845 domain-containing protein [Duganella vulcania]